MLPTFNSAETQTEGVHRKNNVDCLHPSLVPSALSRFLVPSVEPRPVDKRRATMYQQNQVCSELSFQQTPSGKRTVLIFIPASAVAQAGSSSPARARKTRSIVPIRGGHLWRGIIGCTWLKYPGDFGHRRKILPQTPVSKFYVGSEE